MDQLKTKIIIERTSQWTNKLREIGIYLNGQKIDTIKNGETKEYEVKPGRNELYAKIDWYKTTPLILQITEGETKETELGSNMQGWKMFFAMYYVLFAKDFLYLKENEKNHNSAFSLY